MFEKWNAAILLRMSLDAQLNAYCSGSDIAHRKSEKTYCHVLSDDRRILEWQLESLDNFIARDYTLLSHTHSDDRSHVA